MAAYLQDYEEESLEEILKSQAPLLMQIIMPDLLELPFTVPGLEGDLGGLNTLHCPNCGGGGGGGFQSSLILHP